MNQSFIGISKLYGEGSLAKLANSHVMVIGIGGVGSWACESLARSGIGEITMVDMDDICVSNINRQVHALSSTVGQEKVEVMKKRLLDINPELKVSALFEFFTPATLDSIFNHKPDYIIDAMDSISNKCLLVAEAKKREHKIITTGGAAGRIDPTLFKVCDLNRTVNDRLCKRMKRILKKDYDYARLHKSPYKIPCVSSSELITNEPLDEQSNTHIQNCQTSMGSAGFVTATMGMIATSHVVSELTK